MRLAIVGPSPSGLARVMAERGHEVRVYERRSSPDAPSDTGSSDVGLVRIEAGPPHPLTDEGFRPYVADFAGRLSEQWRSWRPDVVHAHAWRAGLAVMAGREQPGPSVVHTPYLPARTTDSTGRDRNWTRLELALCHRSDAVIVHTDEDLSTVLRAGIPRARTSVIPLTVDPRRFCPTGPEFARTTRHRLVAVGPLRPEQRFARVIAALRHLPDTELVIADGTSIGESTARSEAERLRQLAERCGVDGRFEVFDALPDDRRPELLRSADIVVSVPERERFGLGVLEAMACGRAVIASATGGHLDTVVHETTGLLVPDSEPATLVPAVRTLLNNRILLDGYGLAGRERAVKRYSWDTTAKAYEATYKAIAARN